MATDLVERKTAPRSRGKADVRSPKHAAWQRLVRLCRPSRVRPLSSLGGRGAAKALVERTVREVSPHYRDASIEVETVELTRVRPLSLVLESVRNENMRTYLRMLRRRRIRPYVPAAVRFRGEDTFRLALPPVLEEHGDVLAVVDGTHRLSLLVDRSETTAVCVVVRGKDLPSLPSEPVEWRSLRVKDDYLSRAKKFRRFRRNRFRPAGSYLRNLEYANLRELRDDCAAAERAAGTVVSGHWCEKHQRLDNC
jgi:hypothetical protein